MKAFRALLLILLVVLLPLRGALAGEKLCAAAHGSSSTVTGDVDHDAGRTPGAHQHHGSLGAIHGHHDHAGTGGQCNVCSVLCGMAGPMASMAVPPDTSGAVVFSRLQAPPARLISERLERPPRTA